MKVATFIALCLLVTSPTLGLSPGIEFVQGPDGQNVALAVPHATGLVIAHTKQFLAADAAAALDELDQVLRPAAGYLLKLNVVAASHEHAEAARRLVRERYRARHVPPLSVVIGRLPNDARIGVDAVAIVDGELHRLDAGKLPRGPRVYISGQAERGETVADAADTTIGGLLRTLEFVGSTPDQVVQAKCFLTPMSAAPDVVAAFERAFGADDVPPLVFVEWKSALPIEIELIAAAPAAPAGAPAIEYLTPPGQTASPLFARIVKVNHGGVIYVGDIGSARPGSGEQQVTSIFEQLQDVLKRSRSDLRHLVKATYYVSDDDASKQLNVLRPKYYDPARPPAASKAMVPAVGVAGRSITIDMIAVPATQRAVKP